MSYCLNPTCPNPQNPDSTKFCQSCGAKLLLKDRYQAIKPIGQGGFGKTFLAVDEDKPSKPRCVIKQFFPQAQGTNTVQKAAELFTQEAVRLDELGKHPQIPELMAYFTQDSRQYLVQEFIDGQNLADFLRDNGAFNEAQLRQFLTDLLTVLQFVHSHQVIHRDIKPENIIRRGNGQLVLVDFGASKLTSSAAAQKTGTSIGSPEYVAPEQARGRAMFCSDIYSLGVTCIHLLTERSPFDLYDVNEDVWIWRQYLSYPVSETLGKVLDKMLETIPNRRYQTVEAVLQALKAQGSPTVVNPPKVKPAIPSPSQSTMITSAPNPPSRSQVDLELEQMKAELAELAGGNIPNSHTQREVEKSKAQPPAKSKSVIDLELEEMKSQFLNPPNPKKKAD